MKELKFVDKNFNQLPENADQNTRYAIDLGVRTFFAERFLACGNELHYFVLAFPLIRSVNLQEAYNFLKQLQTLNPDVEIGLLEDKQIDKLNYLGASCNFCIKNCWTCSTCDDWHGRIDGYYSYSNGKTIVDWGENITDVYFVFGFKPSFLSQLILP